MEFLPTHFLAAGGLVFAFENSTTPGRIVLFTLFTASIFSWAVMITKLRIVHFAKKQAQFFRERFRADRQPLRLYEHLARFDGTPIFHVYHEGCRELTFHLLGSPEVDETFRARLDIATKISPAQMRAVQAAMDRAVGESSRRPESQT